MALRLANQINRRIVKTAYRSLSAKREPAEAEVAAQNAEDTSKLPEAPPPPATTQYEVCPPRKTPIVPFPSSVQNETDAVRKTLALQHLQPSMLPEYYKPPVEINAPCMYLDPITETEKQNMAKNRKFEESNTCKNVVLPLRPPKLASPFPEPVKVVMHSNTVSDQEKAQQMLAEAKLLTASTSNTMQKQPSIRSLPPMRSFSSGHAPGNVPPQSKKVKACKLKNAKEKCPKRKLPGCPPVSKNIACKRKKAIRPPCVRKHAPYPSYSESCHEDPDDKPSECKICPYKWNEHPTFKPSSKDLHTFSAAFAKRKSGDCKKPPTKEKKPCAYKRKEEDYKRKDNTKRQPKPELQERLSIALKSDVLNSFQPEKKRTQIQKEAKRIPMQASKPQIVGASAISLSREMGSWLDRLQPENLLTDPLVPIVKAEDEDGAKKGPTKFPFKQRTFKIVTERKSRRKLDGQCPKKPKRKLVKDCPPQDTECKKTAAIISTIGYLMKDKKEDPDQKKFKKKCPKFPMDKCLEPVEDAQDPCKRKKKGKTLICPTDLLEKKPWSKKKKKKTCPLRRSLGPVPRLQPISKSEPTISIGP